MKSLKDFSYKDFSSSMTETDYHAYPAWSYSKIAKYLKEGFNCLATIDEPVKPTPSMEFGSLFDCMMTRPEDFDKEYVVFDKTPAPSEKAVLDVLALSGKPFSSLSDAEVEAACQSCSYQSRWKADTKRAKLMESMDYYDAVRSGKKIVSTADFTDAKDMYSAMRSNEYISSIFGLEDGDGVEYIYQSKFIAPMDVNGTTVMVKTMPDLIVVNHKERTIQLVDLKTSSMEANKFYENFVNFRYDVQANVYTDVLKKVLQRKDYTEYSDYGILPYLFVDISRSDKVPVAYKYDQNRYSSLEYTKGDKTYKYADWRTGLAEILDYQERKPSVPNYLTADGPNDIISILSGGNGYTTEVESEMTFE